MFGFVTTSAASPEHMPSPINWTYTSTIAWGSPAWICEAHRHRARVVMEAPTLTTDDIRLFLTSPSRRAAWVNSTVRAVIDNLYDGITFDYEDPLPALSAEVREYTQVGPSSLTSSKS